MWIPRDCDSGLRGKQIWQQHAGLCHTVIKNPIKSQSNSNLKPIYTYIYITNKCTLYIE